MLSATMVDACASRAMINGKINGGIGSNPGGRDFDYASYITSALGVIVSLKQHAGYTGDAAGDYLFAIEALEGSQFDDSLEGDVGDNRLDGLGGNDVLIGNEGDDWLDGGLDDDELMGG